MFTLDDMKHKNPIPASQFLFLDKSAFIHTSNINYELMYQDIIQKELKPEMADRYVFWLLDILSAYDEQKLSLIHILAALVGVSGPAVSKWETEVSHS